MTMTQNQPVVSLMLRLQNMGCKIWAENDKLRIRTSKNALTDELKQEIQGNKAEILAFLKAAKTQVAVTKEIPTLSADSPKPLSFAQQRLWLLAQLQGPSATYNMPIALQLNGNLNIDALRSSLAYLLSRHESLRIYFPTVAGQPQIALRNLDELEVLMYQVLETGDWGLGTRNQETLSQSPVVQHFIDAHAQEPFDLNTGPLFKAKLLQLQDRKSVLLINTHHMISDGWSMGVFVRELRQAYTAFTQGQSPNLSPLPIQYSDYAAWQRNWLQGEVLENQINYWKNQLGDASPLLELPTDYPRPAQQSYRGDRFFYSLTPELTAAVKNFSQQQGVSLFMTLLATLNILLSRYSRQSDLSIGSPIANRTHSKTEGLIGFFVNTLVLRNQINSEQSFIEFLQQTRQTCLDAYAHQDIPFEVLVEKLQPERSMSYNPLFQVMFALENNESPDLSLSGLEIEWLGVKGAIAKFDLTLMVMEYDNKLNCSIEGLYTAPRNEVEQKLAQLWSAVVERQEIGIHDNFFDLGGHSLLAVKLLNNIQQVFEQQLALSSLFQNPTIAQLAEQICNIGVQQSHPDLLLLQPQGNATSLFCLPGANGHGFYFQDLATNLGNEHPVYGLETPGRDGLSLLPDSVELHASQLIEVLRQQQPKSPYILAGYSSGCAVAFEMASQLEQQGEKVELLAILDSGLVTHPQHLIDRTELDWIWQLLQRIEALKGVSFSLEYADLAAQNNDQARWDLAAEYLYKHHVLPEHSSLDLLKTNMQVMKMLTLNYANYQPKHSVSVPIVLFRAQEAHEIVVRELQAFSDYDLPDWGWQTYTQKPIKVIYIPGNHGRMLYEPNVKVLATQLQTVMQEAKKAIALNS